MSASMKYMNLYQFFNFSEAIIWLIAALILRKIVVIKQPRHSTACHIATAGFLLFSASDFIEATLTREFHLWLWILKITCGVIFMIARFYYVGKKDFKWTDRYLIFFTLCLSVAIGVICSTV
ncbi:MAG: hypothetical protein ACSHX6_00430 [Akkermansiaceae bacterium]